MHVIFSIWMNEWNICRLWNMNIIFDISSTMHIQTQQPGYENQRNIGFLVKLHPIFRCFYFKNISFCSIRFFVCCCFFFLVIQNRWIFFQSCVFPFHISNRRNEKLPQNQKHQTKFFFFCLLVQFNTWIRTQWRFAAFLCSIFSMYRLRCFRFYCSCTSLWKF